MRSEVIESIHDTEIKVFIEEPETAPIGIIQIIHGLGEHFNKYKETINYLKNEGFIVVMYDQNSHGHRNEHQDFIHFSDHEGYQILLDEAETVYNYAKRIDPNLPIFAVAHSMGSFILRALITKNTISFKGVVLTGSTYVPKSKLFISSLVGSIIKMIKGPKHVSHFMRNLTVDAPYRSMKKNGLIEHRHEWITSDKIQQSIILNDPLSGYPPTIAAQLDMLKIVKLAQDRKVNKNAASSRLITVFCGEEDALCEYGEGVKRLINFYQSSGFTNLNYRIYANARHELHSEVIRPKVMNDITQYFKTEIQ